MTGCRTPPLMWPAGSQCKSCNKKTRPCWRPQHRRAGCHGEWLAFFDHDDSRPLDKTRQQLALADDSIAAVFSVKFAEKSQGDFEELYWRNLWPRKQHAHSNGCFSTDRAVRCRPPVDRARRLSHVAQSLVGFGCLEAGRQCSARLVCILAINLHRNQAADQKAGSSNFNAALVGQSARCSPPSQDEDTSQWLRYIGLWATTLNCGRNRGKMRAMACLAFVE